MNTIEQPATYPPHSPPSQYRAWLTQHNTFYAKISKLWQTIANYYTQDAPTMTRDERKRNNAATIFTLVHQLHDEWELDLHPMLRESLDSLLVTLVKPANPLEEQRECQTACKLLASATHRIENTQWNGYAATNLEEITTGKDSAWET